MINKEFLADCSDEQINKGVAWLEANNPASINDHMRLNKCRIGFYKFCLNPSDIMPIQIANNISLQSDHVGNGVWFADDAEDITIGSTNPLRAICEVYILMSVAK
jgi:hypothetical protein